MALDFKKELQSFINLRKGHFDNLKKAIENGEFRESAEDETEVKNTLEKIKDEIAQLEALLSEVDEPAATQPAGARAFNPMRTMESRSFQNDFSNNKRGVNNMSEELRSFQKFIINGGKSMSEAEQRALNISGSAAVLPVEIYDELITEGKYSDLLHRAKVFNEPNAGKLYIPIASGNAAGWHEELTAGTEASPTLSKIELGGFELMRLMSMSAAADSMTEAGFKEAIMQLLSAEVVETLENAFINGTGNGQPKGLNALTWTDENTVTPAQAAAGITYKDIAAGLGKLPQKYARNAILLMNADTAYNTIAAAEDSNGQPVLNIGEAAKTMLGHEVVISEHCPANTIFIVDARELYIRFSMPVKVETDRSSGFTSAVTNIRALTVVDAAWNSAACVKVYAGE